MMKSSYCLLEELDQRLTDFGHRLMCEKNLFVPPESFDESLPSCALCVVLPTVLVMVFEAVCALQRVPFIYLTTLYRYAQRQTVAFVTAYFLFFYQSKTKNAPFFPGIIANNVQKKKNPQPLTTTSATIPIFYHLGHKMYRRHVDPLALITRVRRVLG